MLLRIPTPLLFEDHDNFSTRGVAAMVRVWFAIDEGERYPVHVVTSELESYGAQYTGGEHVERPMPI